MGGSKQLRRLAAHCSSRAPGECGRHPLSVGARSGARRGSRRAAAFLFQAAQAFGAAHLAVDGSSGGGDLAARGTEPRVPGEELEAMTRVMRRAYNCARTIGFAPSL